MEIGFMPEITLILKDGCYGKSRALITRWRKCGVYKQFGYDAISVIKADNDSMWDNDNAEWLKIRSEFEIEMVYPAKSDGRGSDGNATWRASSHTPFYVNVSADKDNIPLNFFVPSWRKVAH